MSASRYRGKKSAANELPQINLKIKGLEDGNLLMFRTEKRASLQKLMTTYCNWVSVDFNENRFFFDGREINEEDTPAVLGMEDGSEIHALRCQCAIIRSAASNLPASPPLASHDNTKKPKTVESPQIRLKVKDMCGDVMYFTLRKETQLKKLMKAFCDRATLDIAGCWFLYDGRRIEAYHTPEMLGMKDGDQIDFLLQLTGS